MIAQVFLTRRNLLTLLSKLDRKANGEDTECTIIKRDNQHAKYPQTMKSICVTAVEDDDYYVDGRIAGAVCLKDNPDPSQPEMVNCLLNSWRL